MAVEPSVDQPSAAPQPTVRQLTNSEFQTAMVHFYRGEVSRANVWRTRLDGTTNWAVLTTATSLSFAFSNARTTHVMLLINSLLVLFFLFIEARRYRFYDLWRARVRLMETEFFAEILAPTQQAEAVSWRTLLADDLLHPRFSITMRDALARRLRRNYVWIFGVLLASWVVKILIHPYPANSWSTLDDRIAIGPIPTWLVLLIGIVFNLFVVSLLLHHDDYAAATDVETLARVATRERMGRDDVPYL